MKYEANMRRHYFVDTEEVPSRGELKRTIREAWMNSYKDKDSLPKTGKNEVLAGVLTFAKVAAVIGAIIMLINENFMGVMVAVCLFAFFSLLFSLLCKNGVVSTESFISGNISNAVFFVAFIALAVWIGQNQADLVTKVESGEIAELGKMALYAFMGIPVVFLISKVLGHLIVRKQCSIECNAECIGLDAKLVKKGKSKSHRVMATPVFSYRYGSQDYVAMDGFYILDYEKLPKKGEHCVIYINPKQPEDMLQNKEWKSKIVPSIVFSVFWIVACLFILSNFTKSMENVNIGASGAEENVELGSDVGEDTTVIDPQQGYDTYAADGRFNLHDVEINQYCINSEGEIEEWDIYLREVTAIEDLGDGTSNLYASEVEGAAAGMCISNTDSRYSHLEVGDEVYWIQKGNHSMIFPVEEYLYIGEKTVQEAE